VESELYDKKIKRILLSYRSKMSDSNNKISQLSSLNRFFSKQPWKLKIK
jgi:hypothetical protein